MSIRTVTYTLGGEHSSPPIPQYGGVRYEDNATRVDFVLEENYKHSIENAYPNTQLVYRIDFNSLNAGYNPSENIDILGNTVSRTIPLDMTFFGEQITAVLIITVLDTSGNAIGTVLSPEVKIYFDNIEKDEIREKEIFENISAAEQKVKSVYLATEKWVDGFSQIKREAAEFAKAAENEAKNSYMHSKSAAESAEKAKNDVALSKENAEISTVAAEKCKIADSILTECQSATHTANTAADSIGGIFTEFQNIKKEISDGGFIKSIEEKNKGLVLGFWVGTRAEYDTLEEKPNDCYVVITDDNTLTDFIVEQGEVDGWIYRKWNSGMAELWTAPNITTTFTTKIAEGHYAGTDVFPQIEYPFTLYGTTHAQFTLNYAEAEHINCCLCGNLGNTSRTPQYRPYSVREISGATNITGRYYVMSRWKE